MRHSYHRIGPTPGSDTVSPSVRSVTCRASLSPSIPDGPAGPSRATRLAASPGSERPKSRCSRVSTLSGPILAVHSHGQDLLGEGRKVFENPTFNFDLEPRRPSPRPPRLSFGNQRQQPPQQDHEQQQEQPRWAWVCSRTCPRSGRGAEQGRAGQGSAARRGAAQTQAKRSRRANCHSTTTTRPAASFATLGSNRDGQPRARAAARPTRVRGQAERERVRCVGCVSVGVGAGGSGRAPASRSTVFSGFIAPTKAMDPRGVSSPSASPTAPATLATPPRPGRRQVASKPGNVALPSAARPSSSAHRPLSLHRRWSSDETLHLTPVSTERTRLFADSSLEGEGELAEPPVTALEHLTQRARQRKLELGVPSSSDTSLSFASSSSDSNCSHSATYDEPSASISESSTMDSHCHEGPGAAVDSPAVPSRAANGDLLVSSPRPLPHPPPPATTTTTTTTTTSSSSTTPLPQLGSPSLLPHPVPPSLREDLASIVQQVTKKGPHVPQAFAIFDVAPGPEEAFVRNFLRGSPLVRGTEHRAVFRGHS